MISIIIPYYQTLSYTIDLLTNLENQKTDEVEIIVVDDGCNEKELDKFKKCKIIHSKENGGLSVARNIGFANSTGKYIIYIDSDDNVSNDFIKTVTEKVKETDFDCCYYGWRAVNNNWDIYIDDKPRNWNWAVWNAIYKRELIEEFYGRKFEDVEWQKKMRPKFKKVAHIHKILYYYNNGREGSITDLHGKGLN